MELLSTIQTFGSDLIGPTAWYVVWTLIKIVCIALPMISCVAYLTYWERKMIGFMHVRRGPSRVGYRGLLQPFADVFMCCRYAKQTLTALSFALFLGSGSVSNVTF